jgi:peptidoglycan/xylan/chitin deacetylase (PgdA/CDA1 family)
MNWLDSLRQTLDSSAHPVSFFFRDDDAGWEDTRLFELVYLFARYNVPIDLAVIPRSISPQTAARLRTLAERFSDKLSLHQHGYAHVNHEPSGRKCEFGETRKNDLQLADIHAGKHLLRDLFGTVIEPIFTPPWNRCTAATVACLREEGFALLSRDTTATPLKVDGLVELPISVDWFAKRKGVRLTPNELGEVFVNAARRRQPVGVMVHHAVMDENECTMLGELLQLVSGHSQARCVLMRDLIAAGEVTS